MVKITKEAALLYLARQDPEKLKLYRQNRTAHKQTCHWLTLPE